MVWPVCDSKVVNLMKGCATDLGTDTKKLLAGNDMHVCVAGEVLSFCLAAFDFHPDPLVHSPLTIEMPAALMRSAPV